MVHPALDEVAPARFAEVAPLVARLDDAALATDGHRALDDAVRLDLEHPTPASAGFLLGDRGYAHVAPADNGPAGNGAAAPQWMLGIVTAAGARAGGTRDALVAAAVRHVAAHGGGRIVYWVAGASDRDDAELAGAGLHPARELYEMRAPLPLAAAPAPLPAGVRLRPFRPGADDAAWVEVNNRAFAGHAEQGGWTVATLARRFDEPWFDPELFLLAVDDTGIAGFNWLKVHEPQGRDPRLGEIYVIGVDPRAQGTGLGRALAVAGLTAVHERGIDTALLFCAADNAPALALYRALGFTVHRTDRAYERMVAPA